MEKCRGGIRLNCLIQPFKNLTMKQLSISLVLIALAFSLFAQDEVLTSKNGVPILPAKGDFSIGIDAVPFFNIFKDNSASPGFNFANNIPLIAMKYFLADNRALRMEYLINYNSLDYEGFGKDVESSFGVNVGHEWRMGISRVQGYIGVQGGALYSKSKTTDNNENVLLETSTIGFGADGFIGAEYFVAPKLSIGGQFTWGPQYTVNNDIVTDEKIKVFDISANNANGALMLTFHF